MARPVWLDGWRHGVSENIRQTTRDREDFRLIGPIHKTDIAAGAVLFPLLGVLVFILLAL